MIKKFKSLCLSKKILYIESAISIIVTGLMIYIIKNKVINKTIHGIICIMIIILLLDVVRRLIVETKDKKISFFYSFILLLMLIMSFVLQLYIVTIINSNNLVCYCILFIVYYFIAINCLMSSLNYNCYRSKMLVLIIGLSIYMLIIFDGCTMLFTYFATHNFIDKNVLNEFKDTKKFKEIIRIISNETLFYFYNLLQDYSNKSFAYYVAYFIGKFTDLFFLGYVASQFMTIGHISKRKYKKMRRENERLKVKLQKYKKIININSINNGK